MMIRSRSDWVAPGEPVNGPAFPGWDAITDGVVWHYPGHDNPPATPAQVPQSLRNTHHHYLAARGYSIGYGWFIDPFGGVWEARGTTFRNAANAGGKVSRNVNHTTVSVQVMTGIDGQPTAAQWAVMPLMVEHLERQAGRELAHQPHSHWEWTTCPGDPIRAWLAAGDIRPATTTVTDDLQEDDDMTAATLWRDTRYANVFLIGAGGITTVSPAVFDSLRKRGVPLVEERHPQMLDNVLHHLGLKTNDLVRA